MPSTRSSAPSGPSEGRQPSPPPHSAPETTPAPAGSSHHAATAPVSQAQPPPSNHAAALVPDSHRAGEHQHRQQHQHQQHHQQPAPPSPPPAVLGKRKGPTTTSSAGASEGRPPPGLSSGSGISPGAYASPPTSLQTSPRQTHPSARASPPKAEMDVVMHGGNDGVGTGEPPFGLMGLPTSHLGGQQHYSPSHPHFASPHPHPHPHATQQQHSSSSYYPHATSQAPGQMLPPGPIRRPSVQLNRPPGVPTYSQQPPHGGINGHAPHITHRNSMQDLRQSPNGRDDVMMDGDASSSTGRPASNAGSGNGDSKDGIDPPRTGRACLACRKLKTRCDGAEDPPCRRCRQGGHECVFVESKRGKRPAKKHASGDLVEKFKQVEQTLNMVIQSINSGQPPDAATVQHLHRMQQSLASDAQSNGVDSNGGSDRFQQASPSSGTSISNQSPAFPSSAVLAGTPNEPSLHRRPSAFTGTGAAATTKSRERQPSVTQGAALSMLAEASLAAELDGSKGITDLDPTFNLSKVTEALEQPQTGDSPSSLGTPSDKVTPSTGGSGTGQGSTQPSSNGNGPMGEGEKPAPALLTKGIVDADTAVELFRVFFDYCYIHLPLLDPAQNSATAVCSRSPFLFTVICAIASRFHPNPELDPACYEEAHASFMNMIVTGERTIEAVQACMLLTVWTAAPKATVDDRPQQAWLYHGMAVRVAMELGLFRPPAFSDLIPMRNGRPQGGLPWNALKDVPQEAQREALNRERTWLLLFIIDRYIATVTGRPYQVHDARKAAFFTRGSMTFKEAYERTGRVLNVSVIPYDTHSPTKLLNYLTAPNCVIYTAIIASAAVPGVLNPVVLLEKKKDGSLRPWEFQGRHKDGSLRVDIPLETLHLYFNAVYSVVSQVNPHVHLFNFQPRGAPGRPVTHRKGKGWRGGYLASFTEQFLKIEMRKNFRVMRDLELMPNLAGQDFSAVFLQKFEGTVTIWPKSRAWDWVRILSDPSRADLTRMIDVGKRVTWPKLHMLDNRIRIERQIFEGRFDYTGVGIGAYTQRLDGTSVATSSARRQGRDESRVSRSLSDPFIDSPSEEPGPASHGLFAPRTEEETDFTEDEATTTDASEAAGPSRGVAKLSSTESEGQDAKKSKKRRKTRKRDIMHRLGLRGPVSGADDVTADRLEAGDRHVRASTVQPESAPEQGGLRERDLRRRYSLGALRLADPSWDRHWHSRGEDVAGRARSPRLDDDAGSSDYGEIEEDESDEGEGAETTDYYSDAGRL